MKNKVRYMLVVCAILLTGCGKNRSDDIKQDMSAPDANVSTDTDAKAKDDTGENYDIPENINYEVAGTNGTTTMSVDATVESYGYGNARVYDEKPVEIDSKYLTSYAEQIFDDGSYYSIKPYRCMNEDELSEERDFWESESDRASEEYDTYTDRYIKSSKLDVIDSYFGIIGEYSGGWKQDGVIWSHALTQEDGDYNGEVVVENAKLRGFIDGTAYELTYNVTDDSELPILQLINPLYDNKNDISGYSMSGQSSTLYGNNIVDSEFAKNEADDFIYKLGYEDMTLARTADIQLTDNTLDGYLLVYVRNMNGVPVIDSKSCTYVEGYYSAGYQEYIEVYVNKYGVTRVRLMNMYEIDDIMSDDTSLLSFDRIDENAKSYLKAHIDSGDYYYKINKVRFGYVSVCYGDSYALIPAWVYQYYEASFDEYNYEFAINAIDGSLIDMNYAEYTFYYID